MANKLNISTSQYEEALAEIIQIQDSDATVNLGRLEELTARIDAFEQSVWSDNMFDLFSDAQLQF
jgi:hypothetical protein